MITSLCALSYCFQVFTSHGPTVIMPTWFCSREWFYHVGRFDEGGKGIPEDLLFFYEHLRKGGGVFRVDQCLLLYRYHPQAATNSILDLLQMPSAKDHPRISIVKRVEIAVCLIAICKLPQFLLVPALALGVWENGIPLSPKAGIPATGPGNVPTYKATWVNRKLKR
ncbi:UDP-GlcNAc:betaGal beta-1,3-N-acetylglucosaminyltransferase-like protein 1 [Varanus komodoensis]|nr:UDP-GlcNAc:betaGal beta-1,3-N-acetylglucosaminyltransferase-like protein 1 [Varanus komodoensis]